MTSVFLTATYLRGGELNWQTQRIEALAKGGDAQLDFDFRFRNPNQTSVKIVSVRSDCECTTATADKETYKPGDDGTIHVRVAMAGFFADVRKTIFVTTSGDPDQPALLTVRIKIPEIATVEPRILLWDEAHPATPKFFTVRIHDGVDAKVRSVKSKIADFAAAIEPIDVERTYHVSVGRPKGNLPQSVDIEILIEANAHVFAYPATVIFR